MAERTLELGPTFVSPIRLTRDGKTCLLIVDMQKTVVSRDHGFALAMDRVSPGMGDDRQERIEKLVIPTIQQLLGYFREQELPVIYLAVGSSHRDYRDLPAPFRETHQALEAASGVQDTLWEGSEGYAIREEVAPLPGELVIRKRSFGAFNSSNIDEELTNRGIENLVITGVGTSACVETTARDAADRGYRCVLVDEGMASYDPAAHEATLRAFHNDFGRVVSSAEEIIDAIDSGTAL